MIDHTGTDHTGTDHGGTVAGGTASGGAVPPAPRVGAGRPRGPSVGWTELLVAVPLYLGLSVGLGILLFLGTGGLDGPGGFPPATPVLAVTGAATLATVLGVLALRVRWLPAIGLRRTTPGLLLAGVAAGLLCRALASGLGWGYQLPLDLARGRRARGVQRLRLLIATLSL